MLVWFSGSSRGRSELFLDEGDGIAGADYEVCLVREIGESGGGSVGIFVVGRLYGVLTEGWLESRS